MFRKYAFPLLLVGVGGGCVWNILCLFRVIPLEKWPISIAMAGLGALLVIVPFLIHQPAAAAPSSAQPALRTWLRGFLVFGFAWAVTVIACIVFPL